ncbi:carbohydrate ABC transporter permease [Paenibacillaceae bacterium WGS1546]|uniref:carbohydrate ABC transporter permease n=1 Tax=Cohnella sp. WGS1546 TaxID=3366810 RepID=UPI00372CFF71
MKKTITSWLLNLTSIAISLFVAVPSLLILVNSFKNQEEAADLSLSLPSRWQIWENYSKVFQEGKLALAFGNTALVTLASVAGILLFCAMAAYVIQRRSNAFTRLLRSALLMGMVLPISIITTYMFMDKLGLTGNFAGIILLHIATNFAFITYLYIGFFAGIPRELDEAANLDGVEGFKLFNKIIFPLLMPINATALILSFMTIWNDFSLSLYFLNSPSRFTLTLTILSFFGQHTSDWNLVFADVIMISLPVILVYIFLQKYIVAGMTSGAVKS